MKILTAEEEREHYNLTLQGGLLGGVGGVAFGALGVYAATVRYPAFRQLTLPLRAFLVTSSGTFGAIVAADAYSRAYERQRNPEYGYKDENKSFEEQAEAQKSTRARTMDFLSDNRYSIVLGSWVASMGTALGLVGRNPYLTGQQKLVQARVYAQGLTIAVVIISLAFEGTDSARGKGRWETVKIYDPNDPEHKKMIEKKIHHEAYPGEDQWRDMVDAEEQRLQEKKQHRHAEHDKQDRKKQKEQEKKEAEKKERQDKLGDGKSEGKGEKKEEGKKEEGKKEENNGKKKESKSSS